MTTTDARLLSAVERRHARAQRFKMKGNGKAPSAEGFYWGCWRIKAAGTADEDEAPGFEWEVMHVVENCIDETDPEFLMVTVPGVTKWQPLENFVWGDQVVPPGKE